MNSFDILAIIYYVVFGVLLIGTIWFVLDLEFNKNHLMNATPVKFKEFRKWYVVAPDKYLLKAFLIMQLCSMLPILSMNVFMSFSVPKYTLWLEQKLGEK